MNRGLRIVALLAVLPLVGTLGFMLIEGWNLFDSLYMAVITLTTVGFHEVHDLSTPGRTFVMMYLVIGVGVFLYGVAQMGEMIVRAEVSGWFGRHRMDSSIKSMSGHYIVCGFGRMGRSLCRQLAAKKLPFVAVNRDEETIGECREEGWSWVVGDATDDRTLLDAGVEQARGLATVLSDDADNLYIVISARMLAPKLQIIARASDEKSALKMQKAGANRVISLYQTGAMKMAQLLAKPGLEDFFEIFTTQGGELDLAEVHVTADAPYTGQTLGDTDFSRRGVIVVGVRRANGDLVLPASRTTRIEVDDRLIALGKSDAISQLIGP